MTTLQLIYDDHDDNGYSAVLWQQWANDYRYDDNDYTFNTTNFVINKNSARATAYMPVWIISLIRK